MPYGLEDKTIEQLLNIFSSYPELEQVIIYGSRAKGNWTPGSDIDLVVKGHSVTSEILYKIIDDIEDLYLPYKVDISIFDHIDNSDLIEHINRIGKILYSLSH